MKNKEKRGFTLVEVLVGTAVFLVVSLAAYNAYIALFKIIDLGQYRLLAVNLANEQFEIARNVPYSSVGIVGGAPSGIIPHVQTLVRGNVMFTVTSTVRNIDLDYDGILGGSPNDTSPADNKLLEVTISCDDCRNLPPITMTGQIAPKGLESSSSNGALLIRVFDGSGQPVQGASIHVVNVATTTTIVIDDVTDENGLLQLVDLPPGSNAYRIVVSKSGYSSDRTYPIGAPSNPTPSKPDATVIIQQVAQISFAIDLLGQVNISSVNPICTPVGNFDFSMTGSKQIGTNVPKYFANLVTDSSGAKILNNMEWDEYTINPTDATYSLAGIIPLNPVVLNPDGTVDLKLVVVPDEPRMLLVTIKDSATNLPLSSTTVALTKSGFDESQITGKGFINQSDWSGGSGQSLFADLLEYWLDDGNIETADPTGEMKLRQAFGTYNPNGQLESSTMDTGSISNFFSLNWTPSDPPPATGSDSVRFQIATNATLEPPVTWSFKGPDGTSGSYYTIANSSIHDSHSGDRYFRYRTYLSTQDDSVTPNISDVAFTYNSSCTPPGQVIFTDLDSGTYTLTATKDGYTTYVQDIDINSDWQEMKVLMTN